MRSVMQVASLTLFTLAAVCLSAPAMAGRGLTVVVVTDTCSTSARTGRLMEPRSSRLQQDARLATQDVKHQAPNRASRRG